MPSQMTVTLTDQEYQVLAAEAAKRGQPPETLLRDLIQHLPPASAEKRSMTGRELAEKLYREGKLASLATRCPLTQEEQEEPIKRQNPSLSVLTLASSIVLVLSDCG